MEKKVIPIFMMAGFIALSIFTFAESTKHDWRFISDSPIGSIRINGETSIFYSKLDDKDIMDIEKRIENKKDILNEEYKSLYQTYLNEKVSSTPYDTEKSTKSINLKTKINQIEMKKVKTNSGESYIPEDLLFADKNFVISGDGKYTFVFDDYGIFMLDSNQDKYDAVLSEDEEYINKLQQNYFDLYGRSGWSTYYSPISNKNGSLLVYASSKSSEDLLNKSLYILDTKKQKEELLVTSSNSTYYPIAWMSKENILAFRITEQGYNYEIISINGDIKPLPFISNTAIIDSVSDNKIAYVDNLYGHEVKIFDFNNKTEVSDVVQTINYEGQIRLRGGNKGFSPNEDKYACLYVGKAQTSYLKITNIKNGNVELVDDLPIGEDTILDYSWINNNTLLIVTMIYHNGWSEECSWEVDVK